MSKGIEVKRSGRVRLIDLASVQFDEYQRGEKAAHVRSINRGLNLASIGTPIVGERPDGSLWGIDGLQRMTALLNAGIDQWECLVIKSTGPAFEAKLFQNINSKRLNVSTMEQFRAAVFAEDPIALAVVEEVKEAGLVFHFRHHSSKAKSEIESGRSPMCYKGMYDLVKQGSDDANDPKDGKALLVRTLALCSATWPRDDVALEGKFVRSLGQILYQFGDRIDDARFVEKLKAWPTVRIVQTAKTSTAGAMRSIKLQLLERYNHSLRNKLDLDENRKGEK